MTAVAADVPARYDLVMNGSGYMFDRILTPEADLGYTATFIDRQNTSGAYGDNEQDFFLTVSQHDWSGGEGQRFLNLTDQDSLSRFRLGFLVDTQVAGQVTSPFARNTFSQSSPVGGLNIDPTGNFLLATSTQATVLTATGSTSVALTNHGAGTPSQWGFAYDGALYYIAGATKIRKGTSALSFSDFSATAAAGSLAFLNNALYSCDGAVLRTYDTAGTATTLYTWKGADGTNRTVDNTKIVPFGGDLLIYLTPASGPPELWIYDGTGTYILAKLDDLRFGYDIIVYNGVVFLSGAIQGDDTAATFGQFPVVYSYTDGSLNEVWRGEVATSSANSPFPALGCLRGCVFWNDSGRNQVVQYNLLTGGACRPFSFTNASFSNPFFLSGTSSIAFVQTGATTQYTWPLSTSRGSGGELWLSAIDFNTSLTKVFRSVKVDWSTSSGTGTPTVSIGYVIDDESLSPSFTSLASSVTSGTENLFPNNTTGRAVRIQIQLGASGTATAIVKRVYVRAAPVLQSYRTAVYAVDCSGSTKGQPVVDNTGTTFTRSGTTMLSELKTLLSSSGFSITDELSTYTGVIVPETFDVQRYAPGAFIVRFRAREV